MADDSLDFGDGGDPSAGSGTFAITNPDGSTTYYDQNGNYVSGAQPSGGGDNPGATQGGLGASGGADPTGGGAPGTPTGTGPGGTSTGALSSLLRALGLTGASGDPNMAGILGLLGPAISAALGYNATGKATDQMVQGLHDASTQATNMIGGAQGQLTPFINTGQAAAAKLAGMAWNPLAPQFKPLGSGRSLASFVGK